MLREQQDNQAGALQDVVLAGVILVNALIDEAQLSLGHYDLFCTNQSPNLVRFNASTCHAVAEAVPECARLGAICRQTYESRACKEASDSCQANLDVYFDEEVKAHRRSPYDRGFIDTQKAGHWLIEPHSTTRLPRASAV